MVSIAPSQIAWHASRSTLVGDGQGGRRGSSRVGGRGGGCAHAAWRENNPCTSETNPCVVGVCRGENAGRFRSFACGLQRTLVQRQYPYGTSVIVMFSSAIIE